MGPVNPGLKSLWSTLSHDPGGWMPVPSPVYFRSGPFSVCWARNVRCCCNVHRYWIDFWKPLHSMLFNGHWLYSIGERNGHRWYSVDLVWASGQKYTNQRHFSFVRKVGACRKDALMRLTQIHWTKVHTEKWWQASIHTATNFWQFQKRWRPLRYFWRRKIFMKFRSEISWSFEIEP